MFVIDKSTVWGITTYSIYDTNSCNKVNRFHLYKLLTHSSSCYYKERLDMTSRLYKKFGCSNRGVITSLNKDDITSLLNFLLEKKLINNDSVED